MDTSFNSDFVDKSIALDAVTAARQDEHKKCHEQHYRYETILIHLKNLVHMQKHKEVNGKDGYYQSAMPLVWRDAMEILAEIEADNG